MNKIKKAIYLSDSSNKEQDSFQIHTNIAETLFNIVEKHEVKENSYTIGLFGEWGSGKSFIINKLSNLINNGKNNTLTYLYIDVWKYSGFPLLRSILFDLDKQFKKLYLKNKTKYKIFEEGYKKDGQCLDHLLKYDKQFKDESKLSLKESWKKINEILKKYKLYWIIFILLFVIFLASPFIPETWKKSNFYKEFLPFWQILKSFASFFSIGTIIFVLLKKPITDLGNIVFFRNIVRDYTEKANFSPEQFEILFEDILSKLKDEKYVIVFDNIDRCEPSVAYETLSTIKTFMDIKNCFYLIPADDEAIKKYLMAQSGNKDKKNSIFSRKFSDEFIDKIFQTYIRIPLLKEVERDAYIREQLEQIDFQLKLKDGEINSITEILYFAYKGESPRNIIRFINDYSTYFQLAHKSLPSLFNNITLFTLMIAIKQKWYQFERVLIENPTFFYDYLENEKSIDKYLVDIDNGEDLKIFLEQISKFYLPKIKNESIDSYIHFKESEPSFEISKDLKNGESDNIVLNKESIKILLKEFRKTIRGGSAFSVNSFITISKLIVDNKTGEFYANLIKEFWIGVINSNSDIIRNVVFSLLEEDNLIDIINTIKIEEVEYYKNTIELKFIDLLTNPVLEEREADEYLVVFESILKSNHKFNSKNIKLLFKDWKKDNEYLNSLLTKITDSKQVKYLPEAVFKKLLKETIDDKSLDLMENWDHKIIPESIGIVLVDILQTRLSSRNFSNQPTLTQQQPLLVQDSRLLQLIDTSFVNTTNRESFINSLISITKKIIQLAPNVRSLYDLGMKFFFEIVYFSEPDIENIDTNLHTIFNSFIKTQSMGIESFKESINYSSQLLQLSKTKNIIFDVSPEIQIAVYKKLDIQFFTNYQLILSNPIKTNHIETLIKYIKEEEIVIDESKLLNYILNSFINELVVDNADVSDKLIYLNDEFELKDHKQLFIDNKNGIIDYYKLNAEIGIKILVVIKSVLSNSELFKYFLDPLLRLINSKLKASESILEFTNLSQLIVKTENKEYINLLFSICKHCLEKQQELNENYFGISILDILFNEFSKEQKGEIITLINNNDHLDQWDTVTIETLNKLNILKQNSNDEKNKE